ncbi:hypothetical protein PGTUg99_036796 [Puccinia graminis f. sp. tritici]|uniref:Uncharacterized protein n=1 Tax=Puccinia graminis f. sp. tritici TaxID=56615 RepID=A0A5B0SNA4_PUCGR|nr:hypothetical protein PGTUg99_036796 [Puccinia graminis f. sp. tritici]
MAPLARLQCACQRRASLAVLEAPSGAHFSKSGAVNPNPGLKLNQILRSLRSSHVAAPFGKVGGATWRDNQQPRLSPAPV